MITKLELTTLLSETQETIIDSTKSIHKLAKISPISQEDYKSSMKELRRLKRLVTVSKEKAALYRLVMAYIESGVEMPAIKESRNSLMVKMSSIEERLKYGPNGEIRKQGPLDRSSKNKEEKALIAAFDRKYGVKKLKQQLRVLNFILR